VQIPFMMEFIDLQKQNYTGKITNKINEKLTKMDIHVLLYLSPTFI